MKSTPNTCTRLSVIMGEGFAAGESSATAYPEQSVYFASAAHCRALPLFSCTEKPP